jgi:zinc and cadmium transporter
MILTYSIASVALISLFSLIGVFTISLSEKKLKGLVFVLVSLSVGALFGDAFIHLIPEALEKAQNPLLVSISILVGIVFFFILEKFFRWHHIHNHNECDHESDTPKHVGSLVLISDGAHNLIDGILIGASYMISIEVGIATTIAVILHEIPQEIGDFGLLIHAGYTRAKALMWNLISALTAFVGVFIGIGATNFLDSMGPILAGVAAGGFIYIAGSDLVPELHKTKEVNKSIIQLIAILAGVTLMLCLLFIAE